MISQRNIVVKVAKLHPEQIEFYEKLHNNIPEQIETNFREAGYVHLRIFRVDAMLIMEMEKDPLLENKDRVVHEVIEQEWQKLTGLCFLEYWKDAEEIYTLR